MYDRRDELVNIAEMHRRVRAKEAELEEQKKKERHEQH